MAWRSAWLAHSHDESWPARTCTAPLWRHRSSTTAEIDRRDGRSGNERRKETLAFTPTQWIPVSIVHGCELNRVSPPIEWTRTGDEFWSRLWRRERWRMVARLLILECWLSALWIVNWVTATDHSNVRNASIGKQGERGERSPVFVIDRRRSLLMETLVIRCKGAYRCPN